MKAFLSTSLQNSIFGHKNYLNLSDLKIKSVIRPQIPNNLYFLFCSLIIIFGHFKSNFQLNINCSLHSNKLKHLNHFELTLIAAILISNDIFSRLKKYIFYIINSFNLFLEFENSYSFRTLSREI